MDIHLLERLKDIVRSAGTTVRSAQDAAMGIRGPAVNRMFSFDARPSWRVAGNGMPLPAEHLQFVQGVDKTVCTDCVCSGVP